MNNSKPIIFSTPMVKAILSGRKTHTRRVIKPQPADWQTIYDYEDGTFARIGEDFESNPFTCPYGKVGGSLWVRETFFNHNESGEQDKDLIEYKASEWARFASENLGGWSPSIHMPRWASRINLEIINIRVEKLKDISEIDICNEGFNSTLPPKALYKNFEKLWNSINEKRGFSWESNPWVWVIEFKRSRNNAA